MARKISSRTVVNRKALDAIRAGAVDGLEALARTVLQRAEPNVPDDPTTAERIVGDYGIWADGKKVDGTEHQPSRPVLTPAMLESLPDAHGFLKPAIRARLANVR